MSKVLEERDFAHVGNKTTSLRVEDIAASQECLWTAASTVNWITVTSSPSGFGSGTINCQVAANQTSLSRVGIVLIAGQSFVVKQKGQ